MLGVRPSKTERGGARTLDRRQRPTLDELCSARSSPHAQPESDTRYSFGKVVVVVIVIAADLWRVQRDREPGTCDPL